LRRLSRQSRRLIGLGIWLAVAGVARHSLAAGEGRNTALFLLDSRGSARSFAMGGVNACAGAEDAFVNPSALSWTVNPGVSLSQWPGYWEGTRYMAGAGVLPYMGFGTLGVGYTAFTAGEETVEELDGTTRTVQLERSAVYSVKYGKDVSARWHAGAALKYLSSELGGARGAGAFLADAGVMYRTLDDAHSVSVGVENAGTGLQYGGVSEPLPLGARLGYGFSFKPFPAHKAVLGASYMREISGSSDEISAGLEYFPGFRFIAVRAGASMKGKALAVSCGAGIRLLGVALDAGYGYAVSGVAPEAVPLRFTLNYLFGPSNEYEAGKAYLARGMKDKAVAIWDGVREGEPMYAQAQESLRLNMRPPVLEVKVDLQDANGDGVLAGGEKGAITVQVENTGKSAAVGVRISHRTPRVILDSLDIGIYVGLVGRLAPGEKAAVNIPVTAGKDIERGSFPVSILVTESRGFNPPPYEMSLASKPFPPPVLALARYTFREDNSGISVGNGNGKIEPGEQVELTGFVVNAGESDARKVELKLEAEGSGVQVLPEMSGAVIGGLKPGEYRKVVLAFKVDKDYSGSGDMPLKVILQEERRNYWKTQPLELSLNRFYQDPVSPVIEDVALAALESLPALAGPVPGSKAQEIVRSTAQEPPDLKFEVYPIKDPNENGKFEPGEKLEVAVRVRNTGAGTAKGVEVYVTGDETAVALLGSSRIGDLEPGTERRVVLGGGILPESLPRKEAVFKVGVKEERGFSPGLDVKDQRVAFVPPEKKTEKSYPNLEPVPVANRDGRTDAGAIVVGISEYTGVGKLKYAAADARIFKEYLSGVVGIPEGNIKMLLDGEATGNTINGYISDWLAKKKFGFTVLYFAGHGVPDPENPRSGDSYIIPFDGKQDLKSTLIPVNGLVASMEQATSEKGEVLVVLDSCFSGAGGRSPETAQRGVGIVPKFQQKKAMIVSATSGHLPSLEFEKAGHGYFTYFFLLGLKGEADKNGDGKIDAKELFEYTKREMDKELEGKQSPEVVNERDIPVGRYK